MFRLAVRSPVARAAVVAAPRMATRSFLTSMRRHSDAVPIIQGPGGKPGQVPTDLEQATGLERFELLMKLNGEEAFSLDPLEVTRLGTLQDPITVFSLDNTRIVGCTGFPVDSHDTILFTINKEKPVRCPECGCAYKVDFQGVEDHGHGHH
ncbi:hypothetical protein MVLG_03495 [Microbotryum lychnidis-dioicae p1A1 Lamole]|uniref:Cytochrome c oxidase subunit 5b n=1 Tax=Microbotryum lychnidis-dioicae (strain p1A1 Lamole / MvSl-1064) TaxID=683840 RepID=U5H8D2_USTV1|nr:hypothetical protein MVLG_03495 [Microbotryum lychnidis-dioicae p1A1 Lamole]|eukprot:KDE06216.1 hypothetical protein MVLG_03495 [Microbotryum lychnidis-dioicae p1A1 Lamole]